MAPHIVNPWQQCRSIVVRKTVRPLSIALTTDTWVWTCIANDYNDGVITSRQFDARVRDGDALVGTSTLLIAKKWNVR